MSTIDKGGELYILALAIFFNCSHAFRFSSSYSYIPQLSQIIRPGVQSAENTDLRKTEFSEFFRGFSAAVI